MPAARSTAPGMRRKDRAWLASLRDGRREPLRAAVARPESGAERPGCGSRAQRSWRGRRSTSSTASRCCSGSTARPPISRSTCRARRRRSRRSARRRHSSSPICAGSGRFWPRAEGSLLAYARGIAYWHERHRFCGVCGSPTRKRGRRACPALHQPRLRRAAFPAHRSGGDHAGRMTASAACSGASPTGRRACIRRSRASSSRARASRRRSRARSSRRPAIAVDEVTYHSSQPWPFPASLMLGFHARARSRAITVDPEELEHAALVRARLPGARIDDDACACRAAIRSRAGWSRIGSGAEPAPLDRGVSRKAKRARWRVTTPSSSARLLRHRALRP